MPVLSPRRIQTVHIPSLLSSDSSQLDDSRPAEALSVGKQGAVDKTGTIPVLADCFLPPASMNMAEDVEPGFAAQHSSGELAAIEVLA